jgi:hypothetical protein
MKHKNQHFVTESYLKAWCDPETPNNGAYVWVVSKQDLKISRKSPKSLFAEPDFYTYYDSNKTRYLELEHQLDTIENSFIALRNKKLTHHIPLTPDDRKTISLFVSTMYARTKRQKVEGQEICQEYIHIVDNLPNEISSKIKASQDYQDVIKMHKDQPLIFHLFQFVNLTAPYLYLMNCAIYETKTKPGLITSDNPCFWFDPAIYEPNAPINYFGIGSPTLNIIFPISPNQYLSLESNGPDGYIDLHTDPAKELELVNVINSFTASNCDELIVVSEKTFNKSWFV